MENKPPTLWDGNKETPKDLRLPKPKSLPHEVIKKDESKAHTQFGSTVNKSPSLNLVSKADSTVKSNLSADAPEFFPIGYQNPVLQKPATSSVQDRLKKHKVTDTSSHGTFEGADFVDSPDDIRLKHLIATLTKDPGQFSNLLDLFMDTLSPYFEDFIVLSRAAELLVDQAILFPSFRYTAAKLCCFIEQYCPEFRAELHLTCQKELQRNVNKSGLLLFVAELYTQLHHENIYGTYLIDAFKHLLNDGGNENVKSICQALKLTGHSLEMYNKKALDEVFINLNQIKPTVSGTALSLLNSVINLRSSNWGHCNTNNTNSSTSSEADTSYYEAPSTVFYSTDGSKLSSEENDFLAAHMTSTDEFGGDLSDPDELCDPEPEMDEEIQAAFKDFVKLSKR